MFQGLDQGGRLQAFRTLEDQLLLCMDGTEYFSSTQIQCEHCLTQRLKNGQTRHFHAAVTPVIVAPNQRSVIPLVPEFITSQDGTDKQDSECWRFCFTLYRSGLMPVIA